MLQVQTKRNCFVALHLLWSRLKMQGLGLISTDSEQEAQLSLGKADRTAYIRSSASEFQSRRESDLSEVRQFHAPMLTKRCLGSYNER